MKSKLHSIAALALAASLIAAGCGGDDDSDAEPLSKDEFIVKANDICTKGTFELSQAATEEFGDKQPTPEQEADFVENEVVPSIQGQIDEIRDLGIPEGDEDQLNGILDDAEELLGELEDDPTQSSGDLFDQVNEDLTEYGISSCAG